MIQNLLSPSGSPLDRSVEALKQYKRWAPDFLKSGQFLSELSRLEKGLNSPHTVSTSYPTVRVMSCASQSQGLPGLALVHEQARCLQSQMDAQVLASGAGFSSGPEDGHSEIVREMSALLEELQGGNIPEARILRHLRVLDRLTQSMQILSTQTALARQSMEFRQALMFLRSLQGTVSVDEHERPAPVPLRNTVSVDDPDLSVCFDEKKALNQIKGNEVPGTQSMFRPGELPPLSQRIEEGSVQPGAALLFPRNRGQGPFQVGVLGLEVKSHKHSLHFWVEPGVPTSESAHYPGGVSIEFLETYNPVLIGDILDEPQWGSLLIHGFDPQTGKLAGVWSDRNGRTSVVTGDRLKKTVEHFARSGVSQ